MTFFEAVIQGFGLSLGGGTVAVLWRWTEPVRKSMADALRWKLIMWRRWLGFHRWSPWSQISLGGLQGRWYTRNRDRCRAWQLKTSQRP